MPVPRATLVSLAWRAAWLLTVAVVVAAVFVPHRRWLLVIYIAPLVPTGAWWLALRASRPGRASRLQIGIDAAAFLLGAIRVFGGWGFLPHSGHMLFLTFAIATTAGRRFRSWAAVLLGMATVYKLGIREDWRSWAWGLGLGLLAAGSWHLAGRRAEETPGP